MSPWLRAGQDRADDGDGNHGKAGQRCGVTVEASLTFVATRAHDRTDVALPTGPDICSDGATA